MNKKLLSTPAILFFLLFFSTSTSFSQESIRLKPQRASAEEASYLDQHFSAYTLATLGTEEVANLLRSKDYFQELHLEVNNQDFSFNLRARDLRSPNYKLRAWTPQGVLELPRSPNKTYFGFTHEGQYDVRITADEDFFHAMIIQGTDELYIEPARNIVPGAPKNQFVIYWAKHNLKKLSPTSCGVEDGHLHFLNPEDEHNESPNQQTSSRACKVVQIALADDVLMFNKYGSVSDVEDHNMAVINDVETNYDFEFSDDLQFLVVEIYVATSESTDPWTSSLNINNLLDDFTAWGPSGFDNTHDVGGMWSARNFNGDVIGLAWLNAVCTSVRYHVMEDFSTNANFLRVLQAHEMGHNFSANHDAPGSPTIMAPSVNNTNAWSNQSINEINNYIASISCLGPCGIPLPPVADFDADPTEGCTPLVVNFDDQSTNTPTSWSWVFEGGTPGTSTNQNPTVTYTTAGSFNVTLTATNAQGSNSITFTNYIIVNEDPFADFDYSIDGLEVDFQNLSSNATSYDWDFGDGGTSTLTNPIHVYAEDGIYTVTLTVTNECGSDSYTQIIEIITPPTAFFTSDEVEGCEPFEVEFINLSSENAEFFEWSFPGGSPPSSTAFEPTILYEIPGTYNVSLTVFNEAGEDIQTITNYITVLPAPNAEFSYTTNGLQVNFNSLGSLGDTYLWNFGDGGISTNPNPVHTYASSGVYQVSLTVTNDCGSNTLQQTVTVTGAPQALFSSSTQYGCSPLVVQFTNQSGGDPTSFAWVFEGGSPGTSSQQNPIVTYNAPGLYDVQLTVTNSTGSDVLLLTEYIEVEFPTTSNFNFLVNGSQASFTNQSTNSTGSSWNFGDGFTSNETNPVHGYLADGTYTVTLISSGICGPDTSTAQVTIQTPPQAGFSYQQSGDCVPVSVTFTNESSPNATSFAWSFPGGTPSSSNLENPSVTYNSAGTYDVTLIAYSGNGSDTLEWNELVTVGSVPDAAFLLSTDQTTVTFDNESTGAASYFWLFGDGQTSTETNPVHDYGAFGTYTVSLISTNNCGNDTMVVVIELSTVPNAFFGYSDHTGCAPFEVSFIDQSQNNPTSWSWVFDGGSPSTSTLQNPTVVYNTPGTYSVSLQATNSQGTDVLLLNDLIQVGGAPDATFAHAQVENVVSLEYTGIDYDSLRWSFGDGRTDNSLNPTVEYNVSGQYQISLIVYNPCGSDTSWIWVTIVITSTNNPSDNPSGWQIRPNPFKDVFSIYGEPSTAGEVTVSLMDMHGRLISREEWTFSSGQATKIFNEGDLPQGLILVVIQDKETRTVLKALHQ
jgi:PKD repeat protein